MRHARSTAAMKELQGEMRLQRIARALDRLEQYGERLKRHGADLLQHGVRQVDQLGKLLESYSFHSVLNRGFALVRDQDAARPVLAAARAREPATRSARRYAPTAASARASYRGTSSTAPRPAPTAPRRRDRAAGEGESRIVARRRFD